MVKPVRIQRRRVKGWDMQKASPNGLPVEYVGRPSKWGNPFIGPNLKDSLALYAEMAHGCWNPLLVPISFRGDIQIYRAHCYWLSRVGAGVEDSIREELRGKNLCCWCELCEKHKDGKPWDESCSECQPCHVDILLTIAAGIEAA